MDPVVTIGQGQLRGAAKDGVLSFKGIPYAAAPFGENRFAAPQPAAGVGRRSRRLGVRPDVANGRPTPGRWSSCCRSRGSLARNA